MEQLRYALAVMQRQGKQAQPQPQPTGPEPSGIRTSCWHPMDRLARLDLKPSGSSPDSP
jgi:hypothetical protein